MHERPPAGGRRDHARSRWLDLCLMSAYRSYGRQAHLHADAVAAQGARADHRGYAHESWHSATSVGRLARHLRRGRIPTLEEAFGLVGALS